MGWWNSSPDGESFFAEDTGLVWGDSVADIVDDAIDSIVEQYVYAFDRKPKKAELEAGIKFSLSIYDEDGEVEE